MNKKQIRIDKMIDDLVNLQGEIVTVESYRHAGMIDYPGWENDSTSGRLIGVSQRVHHGQGVTYDVVIKSTGSGALLTVALTRIRSFRKGR